MTNMIFFLSVVIAWTSSSPAPPNCFNNFENFDECWEKVEEYCLNDDGEFEDCHIEDEEEYEDKHKEVEHDEYQISKHCYANLGVCLVDEYSSEEKCQKMALQCHQHYLKEKCVASIQTCLAEHGHNPQQCFSVADKCLDKDADTGHGVCYSQVNKCFTGSGYTMEECFEEVSSCNRQYEEQHLKKTDCISEVKKCFYGREYGFDDCFKLLVSCSQGNKEDRYEDSCSDLMDQCFKYKDDNACSSMFDICFHDDEDVEEENDEDYHSCLGNVRYCILHEEDHGKCYDLMSECLDDTHSKPSCSEQVIYCIEQNKDNLDQCHDVVSDCVENDELFSARDCYDHIEHCYTVSQYQDYHICSAFLPVCFAKKEDTKVEACYTEVQDCLVSDYLANDVCHENLKTCLGEEHHGDDKEGSCREKVKTCLTGSNGDAALCYDHLQNYLCYNAQSKKTCLHSLSDGLSGAPPCPEYEDCFGMENAENFGREPNTMDVRLLVVSPSLWADFPASNTPLVPQLKDPIPEKLLLWFSFDIFFFFFYSLLM